MKKLLLFVAAVAALWACSSEKAPFNYRGLAMNMPLTQFMDSLQARGFAVDTAASDSGKTWVLKSEGVPYHVMLAFKGEKLLMAQENYTMSTNDSTRDAWQELRDNLEKELGTWPNMPKHGDDHKVATFETDGGFITLTLENTYSPNLNVRYTVKEEGK